MGPVLRFFLQLGQIYKIVQSMLECFIRQILGNFFKKLCLSWYNFLWLFSFKDFYWHHPRVKDTLFLVAGHFFRKGSFHLYFELNNLNICGILFPATFLRSGSIFNSICVQSHWIWKVDKNNTFNMSLVISKCAEPPE